jgi:hypothetical protein
MRVLVCGDRYWNAIGPIKSVLATYPPDTVLIHGDCRGADKTAGRVGLAFGFQIEKYPAQWDKYGRGAGVIRNQQMLNEGKPDEVIGFHDNIMLSRGTKDMLRRAQKAGIPVKLYDSHYRLCKHYDLGT